jgi:mono/diheme cytochrome c family protein
LVGCGIIGIFRLPTSSDAARSQAVRQSVVPIDPNSPQAQAAAQVFHGPSCAGCHYLAGIWGHTGVALDFAGIKYDREALRRYIRNPKSVAPHALMPPQDKMSDAELDRIVNFLAGLPGPGTNSAHEHH